MLIQDSVKAEPRMASIALPRPRLASQLLIRVLIVFLFGLRPAVSMEAYPEGWEGLSQYRKLEFESLLKEEGREIVLYYIETQSMEGVRFELSSKELEIDGFKHEDRFVCLIDDRAGGIHISSCRSKNSKYTYLNMDLESKPLFNETILPSEIDYSKLLRNGSNIFLYDTYMPYVYLDFSDSFLRDQKFGSDDFVASCSDFHLTTRDGFGSVGIFHTTVRPHFRGIYGMWMGENDSRTKSVEQINLKVSQTEGYRCDQAITLQSGLVLLISEDTVVLVDYHQKVFGTTKLPNSPHGSILFRTIDSEQSPNE